mmetsp:Transcript_94313/g.148364  ORF Transcript_94313/g.148364 Transcript_94313/m.148364 type:complete len:202 (-) Transcript_94313:92-697(-)
MSANTVGMSFWSSYCIASVYPFSSGNNLSMRTGRAMFQYGAILLRTFFSWIAPRPAIVKPSHCQVFPLHNDDTCLLLIKNCWTAVLPWFAWTSVCNRIRVSFGTSASHAAELVSSKASCFFSCGSNKPCFSSSSSSGKFTSSSGEPTFSLGKPIFFLGKPGKPPGKFSTWDLIWINAEASSGTFWHDGAASASSKLGTIPI